MCRPSGHSIKIRKYLYEIITKRWMNGREHNDAIISEPDYRVPIANCTQRVPHDKQSASSVACDLSKTTRQKGASSFFLFSLFFSSFFFLLKDRLTRIEHNGEVGSDVRTGIRRFKGEGRLQARKKENRWKSFSFGEKKAGARFALHSRAKSMGRKGTSSSKCN